ncbi:UNVERIFIED_CONTAM: hypothetical protein K2H54_053088 [Gekko kuhli]
MRTPIPVDERVAIAIWWLANTVSYRLLGQQFGLARSTVAEIVIEVCLALEMELLSSVIRPGPTAQLIYMWNMKLHGIRLSFLDDTTAWCHMRYSWRAVGT